MFTNPLFILNNHRQRGVSLIELIMFIVIISTALVGIMSVMNTVTKNSADPMIHKQTLAIAESLLEEIELQDFAAQSGALNAAVTASNRAASYHIVADYDGFSMTGISTLNGSAVSALSGYQARVSVVNQALDIVPSASAVRITVTVTPPKGDTITVIGYRTQYQ